MAAGLSDMPAVEADTPAHDLMVWRRHTQEPVPYLLDPRMARHAKRGISLLLRAPPRSELGDMIAYFARRLLAIVVLTGQLVGL
jgi:hypothetical protein